MRDVRVRLRLPGLNRVMRAAQPVVNRAAYRMASAAGPGHEVVVSPHKWVGRAFVQQADDEQAKKDPSGADLLRAIDSAKE